MTGLASWLTAVMLKPALVLAGGAALAACLRRQPAAARHAVWTGAILATLLLPALSGVLPPLRAPLLGDSAAVFDESPILSRARDAVTHGDRSETPTQGTRLSPNDAGSARSHLLQLLIVGTWLAGALGLCTRRALAEISSRRIVRGAVPVKSPRIRRLFDRECRALDLGRRPVLLASNHIPAPVAAGIFSPVVLLPFAAEQWDDADLVAALVHELSHIKRRDCLLGLLTDLAAIGYWCNPALLIALRRMRLEGERACDDQVLDRGAEPGQYARLLLEVARGVSRTSQLPVGATSMARPCQLESRLRALLDDDLARHTLPRWIPLALALSGLLVALPAAALTLHRAPGAPPPLLPEPDRLTDSLAASDSERLPGTVDSVRLTAAALAALRGPDSTLARLLIGGLDHTPAHPADLIRERAAWALAHTAGGRLVEPLIAALEAPDWRVRAYSAWALAPARDARTVLPLIEQLDHPVWRLRAMAAYALRESADRRAVAAMTRALTDPAWQVRMEAVGYFAARGDLGRVATLLNDRHAAVRRAARAALTPSP